ILSQQGQLVLHAGAVRVGDQAIGFLGDTGSGKSTLAASLDAAGYPLFSDDVLVLAYEEGVIRARPTYPGLRLWPHAIENLYALKPAMAPMAHYSSKRRIVITEIAAQTNTLLPLASLYILASGSAGDSASISLNRLSPCAACMAIITNSFQLDPTDRSG